MDHCSAENAAKQFEFIFFYIKDMSVEWEASKTNAENWKNLS